MTARMLTVRAVERDGTLHHAQVSERSADKFAASLVAGRTVFVRAEVWHGLTKKGEWVAVTLTSEDAVGS